MTVTGLDARSASQNFDREALAEKVQRLNWFHSIDLGHGIVTPGAKSLPQQLSEYTAVFDPVNIAGRTVIDIGAWNGAFSFEAKRRGAARVLATDHYVWHHAGRDGFDLARATLNYDLEVKDIDIPDLFPESVGTFDVVLFLGVFYHLLDPVAGLQTAARLAHEVLIVETHTDALDFARPAMIMYPGAELRNDVSNWWGPNPACMVALLKQCGFAKVDAAWSGGDRSVYHAWRTDSLRRALHADERMIEPYPPHDRRSRKGLRRAWRLLRDGMGLRRTR
jgi:tRNA (mo5U34)-methyltransferase